MLMQDNLDVH